MLIIGCKKRPHHDGETSKREIKKQSKQNGKVEIILKEARSYIGTPYKFGGTTRAGLDCSGLVLNCFSKANIQLPRTSDEQSKMGKKISFDNMKPGDLVFFTDKPGHHKVVHVGIVSKIKSKREVKFIHASTKLGVVENDLYVSYYENILLEARRVID
jgi:cell wall-associated NlpC family hydrolase